MNVLARSVVAVDSIGRLHCYEALSRAVTVIMRLAGRGLRGTNACLKLADAESPAERLLQWQFGEYAERTANSGIDNPAASVFECLSSTLV